ncbi:MAG: hypothetical protein EXR47_08220 [Dehalococcoidia bacterium]|nr:hypothetical protein [Dehalococcoidia bacterium]
MFKPAQVAQNLKAVKESLIAFDQGLKENRNLDRRLSLFRAWYYIPELDAVGPSKFIDYKGMTAAEYLDRYSADLDGRKTEPVLGKWFDTLEEDTPEAQYIAGKVFEPLHNHGKRPNIAARFGAPVGWRLETTPPQAAHNSGQ